MKKTSSPSALELLWGGGHKTLLKVRNNFSMTLDLLKHSYFFSKIHNVVLIRAYINC